MSSRRKKAAVRNIAMLGVTAALSPLMAMSLVSAAPSAEDCIIFAADASARLAAGGIYSPAYENDAALMPESPAAIEDKLVYPLINFDDSLMLSRGELFIPSGENEEITVPKEHDAGAVPYPESIENRDGVIQSMTYGICLGENFITLDGGGQVRNVTSVPNERLIEESRMGLPFDIELGAGPQVLIMHTHETESFEPYSRDFYDSSFTCRTTDDSKNMAAVGDAMAEQLEAAGISVIHDVTKHDYPSYNNSYDRSRVTVQNILEENPSIKIVLDIHRDAIERSDGTRIAPVTEINGRRAAQVMIICGCDDGTMDMPDCMQNFRFASALQSRLESEYPSLTRAVLFDYRKYNQDLTTGSILIEVGSHANSIDEAVYSGELVGKALADLLLS